MTEHWLHLPLSRVDQFLQDRMVLSDQDAAARSSLLNFRGAARPAPGAPSWGRGLVEVTDQTLPAGAGTLTGDDTTSVGDTACQSRTYGFDVNGNRTSKTTNTGALGQPCPTNATGEVAITWALDAGDRLTTAPGGGSYPYDLFGRQTKVPQADTSAAAGGGTPGDVALGYYDNDLVQTITQNGTTTSYTLDSAGRRATSTETTGGVSTTTTRHYTDNSDNPGWTTTIAGGQSSQERYVEDLGGDSGSRSPKPVPELRQHHCNSRTCTATP